MAVKSTGLPGGQARFCSSRGVKWGLEVRSLMLEVFWEPSTSEQFSSIPVTVKLEGFVYAYGLSCTRG